MTPAEFWLVFDAKNTHEEMYGNLTESEVIELYRELK